jgi:hypothetical protein
LLSFGDSKPHVKERAVLHPSGSFVKQARHGMERLRRAS